MSVTANDIFDCSICHELICSTIKQCTNGHIYCTTCADQIETCSICRVGGVKHRCLGLEKIRETSNFRCTNSNCKFIGPLSHKKECKFNNCTSKDCPFTGTCEELESHLKYVCPYRKVLCPYGGCDEMIPLINAEKHSYDEDKSYEEDYRQAFVFKNMYSLTGYQYYQFLYDGDDRFLIYVYWNTNKPHIFKIEITACFRPSKPLEFKSSGKMIACEIRSCKNILLYMGSVEESPVEITIPPYFKNTDADCTIVIGREW